MQYMWPDLWHAGEDMEGDMVEVHGVNCLHLTIRQEGQQGGGIPKEATDSTGWRQVSVNK